ncbi:MAG TPA: hypothetical protein VFO76_04575 [Candidatus Kapabacteria bacterium]|nr:hypothetical protein [Candidatus Kapabacteria bacterium]
MKKILVLGAMLALTGVFAACTDYYDPFGWGGGSHSGGSGGGHNGGCDTTRTPGDTVLNPIGDTVLFPGDSVDIYEWNDTLGWVWHRVHR